MRVCVCVWGGGGGGGSTVRTHIELKKSRKENENAIWQNGGHFVQRELRNLVNSASGLLFGTKLLPEPMLPYCQLFPKQQI